MASVASNRKRTQAVKKRKPVSSSKSPMATVASNRKRRTKRKPVSSSKSTISRHSSTKVSNGREYHIRCRGFQRFKLLVSASVSKKKTKLRDCSSNEETSLCSGLRLNKKDDGTVHDSSIGDVVNGKNGKNLRVSLLRHVEVSREPFIPLTEDELAEVKSANSRSNRMQVLVSHKTSNTDIRGEKLQCLMPTRWLNDEVSREPFIPLTEDELAEVKSAFSRSNSMQVLVSHKTSSIDIRGEILQCLMPTSWLNDEVINLYLELLKERETRDPQKYFKCHFFNTFFYIKLVSSGYNYQAVKRWTTRRKLGYDLIDCDIIFVPIHGGRHWTLAVINIRERKFLYLDSLNGVDPRIVNALANYLVDEVKDKSGKYIDVKSWDFEYVKDLPRQENGYDCGMFMLKYIDFYSRGLRLQFSQNHMPYFRLRTAKEILRLQAN